MATAAAFQLTPEQQARVASLGADVQWLVDAANTQCGALRDELETVKAQQSAVASNAGAYRVVAGWYARLSRGRGCR